MTIQGAHVVGSIATTTAEETFRTVSKHLGTHVLRIPDGEVGPRFHWILFQGAVFDRTAGLTLVGDEPMLLAGFDIRPFTLDGTIPAEEIEFPELGYASAAIDSYKVFNELREEGVISAGRNFQVSLPTPLAPLTSFVQPDVRPALEQAYTSALLDEVREIISAIPAEDLAIQFDLAIEFAYIETAAGRDVAIPSHAWFEPVLDGLIERVAGVANTVPLDVELGFHLCYGDVEEKHFVEPLDTAHLTAVANGLAQAVDRPITWLHLPVPIDRDDAAYFEPLVELTDAYEELYLGLIHHQDGAEGALGRIAAAQTAGIETFGVATECGFGRGCAERTVPLLQLHKQVAAPAH